MATEVMGVDSPFAIENDQKYKHAKRFLTMLEDRSSSSEINKELDEITDPG